MIYFDNCATSHPKAPGVSQAVMEMLESGCFNINRGGYARAYDMSERIFDVRSKVASFFDCVDSRHVVFTSGVTMSLNIVLNGLLKPKDHVVTTQMEHNAVVRPLSFLQSKGVNVEVARCFDDGKLDISDMDSKITEKTKLVVMSHASNVCGTIMPIREVGALCKSRGVLLMVDVAQTAGVLPISMQRDNIDILAFPCHKGLLAMQGLGGLILSQGIADEITPMVFGGTGSYSHASDMPKELPDRFEAGTLNLPGIVALSVALDYISDIGVDTIFERKKLLLARLGLGLADFPSIRVVGSKLHSDRCGVSALDFPGLDNALVAARLDEEFGIMTRCGLHCAPEAHKALGTYPRGLVRVSPGYFNTESEIDALIEALGVITARAG